MNELAGKLQDIHLAPEPSWWPPAPGWWLLAVLVMGFLYLLAKLVYRRRVKYRPVNHARALHTQAYQQYCSGEFSNTEYLDTCNALLKRLLIHKSPGSQAVTAFGDSWLNLLDTEFNTHHFTNGHGRVLGDARYQKNFDPDCQSFEKLMTSSLQGFMP